MSQAQHLQPMTLEEFEKMPRDERFNYELIDGVVMMSPSPSFEHQGIGFKIVGHLFNQLDSLQCKGYYELDLKAGGDILKPDIAVYCNDNKEVPAIVFEILSPSTRRYDLLVKALKYEQIGVKEYWIIDPKNQLIIVHDYENQEVHTYTIDSVVTSKLVSFTIAVKDIFAGI